MGRSTGKWKLESKSDPRFNIEGGETDRPSYGVPIALPPAARSGIDVLAETLGVEPPEDLNYVFEEEEPPSRSTQSMRAAPVAAPEIPLRWIKNTPEDVAVVLDKQPDGTWKLCNYLIEADFPITPENLAPFFTKILDALAPLEAQEIPIGLIIIRDRIVRIL